MNRTYSARLSWWKALYCIVGISLLMGLLVSGLLDAFGLTRTYPGHLSGRGIGAVVGGIVLLSPIFLGCMRLALCLILGRPGLGLEESGIRNYVKGGFYAYNDIANVEPAKRSLILVRLNTRAKVYMAVFWCVEPKWVIAQHLDDAVQAHRPAEASPTPIPSV